MHPSAHATIRDVADLSAQGLIHFGDVVTRLAEAGVEAYFADYRARCTTYYMADGNVASIALEMPDTTIAQGFDAAALQAAIRGSQRGEVQYPAFKQLSCAAGCIGYMVWISGRHVTYFGRRGETHVELFPD